MHLCGHLGVQTPAYTPTFQSAASSTEHRHAAPHGSPSPRPPASSDLSQQPLPGHDYLRSTFRLREMGLKAAFLLGSLLPGLRAPAGCRRAPGPSSLPPVCATVCVSSRTHTGYTSSRAPRSVWTVSTSALLYPKLNDRGALSPARLPMGCRPCLRPRRPAARGLGSPLPSDLVPAGVRAVGLEQESGASVTYQFWLSFYGFHTKILTFLRGATGHSTFPSRLCVMLTLAALSGRECHPWWVTMCQGKVNRGGVQGAQLREQTSHGARRPRAKRVCEPPAKHLSSSTATLCNLRPVS